MQSQREIKKSLVESLGTAASRRLSKLSTKAREKCTDRDNESAATAENHHQWVTRDCSGLHKTSCHPKGHFNTVQ